METGSSVIVIVHVQLRMERRNPLSALIPVNVSSEEMFLRGSRQVSVEGKQLTGQTGRVVRISWMFPPHVVVEHHGLG